MTNEQIQLEKAIRALIWGRVLNGSGISSGEVQKALRNLQHEFDEKEF